jgi:hypothetical protein
VLHGRVLPSGATLWSAAARPAGYDAGRAMSDE